MIILVDNNDSGTTMLKRIQELQTENQALRNEIETLQFDTVQKMMISQNGSEPLASIVYPQLLGLSMGIDEKTLGIDMNQISLANITSFFNKGAENVE